MDRRKETVKKLKANQENSYSLKNKQTNKKPRVYKSKIKKFKVLGIINENMYI